MRFFLLFFLFLTANSIKAEEIDYLTDPNSPLYDEGLAKSKGISNRENNNEDMGEVSLLPEAKIKGKYVKLADIFSGLKSNQNKIIALAPKLGDTLVLEKNDILKITAENNILWDKNSYINSITISRASEKISAKEIEEIIKDELYNKGVDSLAEIQISNKLEDILIPEDSNLLPEVSDLNYDIQSGRFALILTLPQTKTSPSSEVRISGKVIEMKEIPVASRNILTGEIISNSDINFEVRPLSSLRKNTLIDIDSLIGMKAKRDIRKGSGITLTDISKDFIIQKGQQVSMIIKSGNMSLSAYGIALDNGVKGDIIRLKNIKTNKTVQGKIIEKDSVIVDFGTNFATD